MLRMARRGDSRRSQECCLFVLMEYGDFGLPACTHRESELDRATTHLAILDIGLLSFRTVEQHLYGLATVRTLNSLWFQSIHSGEKSHIKRNARQAHLRPV